MAFPYFPHTDEDIRLMMERAGVKSFDELYSDVPEEFIYGKEYDLPSAMSEIQVRQYFEKLAQKNIPLTCFCGAGSYDHYAPSVVPYILSRSEFLTAYTPYQAEISQGTLRYIFEFQSIITELTGLDVANASMYDGPTAAAEAMMMALASTKKKTRMLLSRTLLPQVLSVIETYAKYHGVQLGYVETRDGVTDLEALRIHLKAGDVAALMVPQVNRYGIVEDLSGFAEELHQQKALLVAYCDPSTLAVIRTPGEWGADIACGDCQSLGMPMSFGGPYAGFLACRQDYLRKLPGRIVGATVDKDGKRAFVLTLQAREQHIRREKATSNICSNQSLMALYATVYVAVMGPEGLRKVNDISYASAHHLHDALLATGLFKEVFDKPFLKEFVLSTSLDYKTLQQALVSNGFFAALRTEEGYLDFCCTEKRTPEQIDALVSVITSLVNN